MASGREKTAYPNPLIKANCLNKLIFWWLKDLIWHDKERDLAAEDLYDASPEDLSEPLTRSLEKIWIKEVADARSRDEKPSLWKVLMRTYRWDFMKFSVLSAGYIAMHIAHPELLASIIFYFHSKSTVCSQWAYFCATMYVLLIVLRAMSKNLGCFYLGRLGMQAKIACSSLIYRKLIRLPSSANQKSDGSVISLLSVDVAKFENVFVSAPFIAIAPVQLLVGTYLISRHVGFYAAIIGVSLLLLQTLPTQAVYSKLTLKFRAQQAARTDYRISLISEIINGMRTVKMYVWEKSLEKLVVAARGLEIASYFKISYLSSVVLSMNAVSYRSTIVAIILAYVLQYGTMTVEQILPVMQLLFIIRSGVSIDFFYGLKNITDISVSVKRLENFLLLEEVKLNPEGKEGTANELVTIDNVTALLNEKSPLFEELSLDFAAKKLYAIVGPIGAGKSSVLKLILEEHYPTSGRVCVRGRVSYCSQEPWLFNGPIMDNILFGEVYDRERYEKIVGACALVEDFNQLPNGDKTLVGERGSNLSGGQRARVNLARAVYREADVYLFDDPLSAVDILVGKRIMKDCIHRLLQDKTRVLITHSIQQLNEVSEIMLLEHGKVTFRGSIEGFRRNNPSTAQFISEETEISKENEIKSPSYKPGSIERQPNNSERKEPKVTEELITKGAMRSSVYMSYVKSGGWKLLSSVILMNISFIIAASIFDFELGSWKSQKNNNTENVMTKNSGGIQNPKYLYEKEMAILGGLIILIIFLSILKSAILSRLAVSASQNIHNDVISRLMTTTLRCFESKSAGTILNRLTEDTGVLDNALPHTLTVTSITAFQMIAIVVSILIANWWIIIPTCITFSVTLMIGKVYVRIIQEINRLSASAKSPILSTAASSMEGVVTIRSCRAEHIVAKDFDDLQDRRTAADIIKIALPVAFHLWIALIHCGFLAFMTYFYIFTKNDESEGGYVGLTLIQIVLLSDLIPFQVIQITEISAHMVSAERLLQFKELKQEVLIEEEPILETPASWPHKGQIIFEHVYLRYVDDSEPVLWDLNLSIHSGSKIGIVGRTGAGKSSIIAALFRFANVDGSISIDGLDTKRVHLYELRSKISVIPQQPVLFKASLRKNLDPLSKFDDSTLYSALESVELKGVFDSLDVQIERGGSNMSLGQRQLLCLARAIVRKNKILVLDEATANVDSLTDAIIQKTIRKEFKDCTVLTIAHRLNTVMDSDKILVMDNGRLIEYDDPFLLLQKKKSHLYKMVEQGGEAIMKNLINIAEQKYNQSQRANDSTDNDEVQKR